MTKATVREPMQDRSRRSLEAIYSASVQLLADGGWEAVTIGEIERRSGVTRGTFYLRFPTRDALVQYVRERMLQEVGAHQAEALTSLSTSTIPLSIEEASLGAAQAMAQIFHRVGRVMVHLDRGEALASGASALAELSTAVQTVLRRAVGDDPSATPTLQFAVELAFAALVARQRGHQVFQGHAAINDDEFVDRLAVAMSSYIRTSLTIPTA